MGMNKIPTADSLSAAAALTTADLAGSLVSTPTGTLTAATTSITGAVANANFAAVQTQLAAIGDDLAAIRTSSNAAVQHMIDDAS